MRRWMLSAAVGMVLGGVAGAPSSVSAGEAGKGIDPQVFQRIIPWKFGQNAADLDRVTAYIRDSYGKPAERKEIETLLLAALAAPEAAFDSKQFVCRQLVNAGTAASVPALAKLLPDKEMSHMALYALARIQGDEASKALRDAMGTLQGLPLLGVINAVGYRRDAEATPALLKLMANAEADVAGAAVGALGKIGGEEAAKAVAEARGAATGRLRVALDNAVLQCADRFFAEGKKAEAQAIYEKLYAPEEKPHVRAAALRGLIAAGGEKAIDLVMKPFTGDDASLRAAAAGYIRDVPGAEATKAFAAQLPKLTPDQQVLMLDALADRGDAAAASAVAEAAKSTSEKVRAAALRALARVGDAAAVPLLAEAVTRAVAAEADAARYSLNTLNGPKVDEAILAYLAAAAEPKTRFELIKSLTARRTASALPALLKAASDDDPGVRQEAFKALGLLADEKTLPGLVGLLVNAKTEGERATLEKAVSTVCGKVKKEEDRDAPLLAALPNAATPAKIALLRTLGKFGGEKPLAAVRAAVKDADPQIQNAAIRALAEWPDGSPADDLLDLVKGAPDETLRIIALRGYVRTIGLPSERPIGEVLKHFQEAMDLAKRPDDKKLILSAMSDVYHPDVLKMIEPYLVDAALKAEAEAATKKIREGMSGPPKVTASANQEKVGNAIDKKPETRWDSGAAQAGGEWFQMEYPVEREISKIVLDATGSGGDYPRGYEVYLSRDGKNWGAPVAKGEGKSAVVTIPIKPTSARFVKIVQTGKTDGLFWSIHELKIEAK